MAKDKKKKVQRPKALPPRGFRDYFGPEVVERQEMLAAISDVYQRYGFDPLETSGVETVEALGKFLPDVDRPNEGVFGAGLAQRKAGTGTVSSVLSMRCGHGWHGVHGGGC